ncbi:MAG: glycosyltransferase [Planctomycetaceae bacterium]
MTSTAERPVAILSAPGSRGDVNPMVAIGRELRDLGFDVVISLAENYAAVARAAGLQAESLISRAGFDAWLGDPNVWKPFHGARLVLREAAGAFIEPHLDVIRRHHRPQRTVLVSHPLDFGSRIYRDHDPSTPMVSVQLSPAIVRDTAHPPRLSPWWFEFQRPPWLVHARYAVIDYLLADRFLCPAINRTRKRLGLRPVYRIMDRWWLSPDLVLGMYPEWFSDVRPRCEGPWQACGFPLSRSPESEPTSEQTVAADTNRNAIFVTPGTAHRYARDLFLNAIAACERIERPCILATSYPEQIPTPLPRHATAMGYASLDPLLRSCAAIIHHGGIGTTSMALSTACPQLICPLAFDQFHNADRVQELGAGRECKDKPWSHRKSAVDEMANSLRQLIGSAEIGGRCQHLAQAQASYRGAAVAAKAIRDLFVSRSK